MLFAESLAIALGAAGYDVRRIPLPESARSIGTVLPAVLRAQPRLALVDLDLGALGNGVRLIEPLVRAHVPVIVVTGNTDRVQWGECVRHGARTDRAEEHAAGRDPGHGPPDPRRPPGDVAWRSARSCCAPGTSTRRCCTSCVAGSSC